MKLQADWPLPRCSSKNKKSSAQRNVVYSLHNPLEAFICKETTHRFKKYAKKCGVIHNTASKYGFTA